MNMLSGRQYAILQFIHQHTTDHGFVPSIREICREVKISSTSVVNYNLERLTAQGFLLRTPGKARAFALTDLARELSKDQMWPMWANSVKKYDCSSARMSSFVVTIDYRLRPCNVNSNKP
ncbi:MAG: winged helix DNA-binding protein [Anaerolineae bacterium]|nr:winged helix DNA-binding protein [Anaerolineae bacterium]